MTRNLDKRVELMFPGRGCRTTRPRCSHALRAMFRDNVKARWLGADGVYRRAARTADEPPFRVQQVLQEEARRRMAAARDRAGVTFRPAAGK